MESIFASLIIHSTAISFTGVVVVIAIQSVMIRQLTREIRENKVSVDRRHNTDMCAVHDAIKAVSDGVVWKDMFEQFEKRFDRVERHLNGSLRNAE